MLTSGTGTVMGILQLRVRHVDVLYHGQRRRQASAPHWDIEPAGRALRVRDLKPNAPNPRLTTAQPWDRLSELHSCKSVGDRSCWIWLNQDWRLHRSCACTTHVPLHLGDIPHAYAVSWIFQWSYRCVISWFSSTQRADVLQRD